MSKINNKNLTIKVLALFISILLWSYVRNEVNPKVIREFREINVEIMNERLLNDSGLVVLEPKEIKVAVKVSGRRSDINAIELEDITAEVDLSGASQGTQKIPIEVRVPFKVDLEDVSERYASFEIDSLITVEKEVNINMVGANQGDIIKESIISPKTIKISGPSRLVNKASKAIVNIDIDKIDLNGIIKLPVNPVDKKGNKVKGVETNPSTVEVSLSLLKSKKVPIRPKLSGSLSEDYKIISINTNPSTVTIRGLEKDIKDIKYIETKEIDIKEIGQDGSINIELVLPTGVKVDSGKEKVTVNVNIAEDITKEILVPTTQISLENISEGLKSSFYDNSNLENISIKLKGNKDILTNLSSDDIKLSLDLDGLEEGIHSINLIASSLEGVTFENVNPESIKVKLEVVE